MLTQFQPSVVLLYPPSPPPKKKQNRNPKGFLMFSGGIEMQHQAKMGFIVEHFLTVIFN